MLTPFWQSQAVTNGMISCLTLLGVYLGIKIRKIEHNTNGIVSGLRKENEEQRSDAKELAAVTEANKRVALVKKG